MGFKKGKQNIDSVFYGTDYVERMYLGGGEPFFQASYLDFYKTNFFSIGLGQKKQINNPNSVISLIKTEWSPQYGYQLEIKQDDKGASMNYMNKAFRDNFSFILPKGNYLVNANLENISSSKGELYCRLVKKGNTPEQDTYLTTVSFYNGWAQEVSVTEDTEVYLGMYINDLNPGQTSIFSLELFPATGETGKFKELPSLMARGRKKEIYNSGASSIDIKIPATAFYEGVSYPVQYIDSDAFNYEVTENGTTETPQPLTKIKTIAVEGNNMIGFGNRAFKNCSSCTSFSCTSSAFQGGLFADNAAFEGCGALEDLTLSIVQNIDGLKESKKLNSISMGGKDTYSLDNSFAGNTSLKTIHWKNKDSSGAEKAFRANFGPGSFKGCTNLKTIVSNDHNAGGVLGENASFYLYSLSFADCTSLNTVGVGFGSNTGPFYRAIGFGAFSGCTGLTSVDSGTREGDNTIIGPQAFENCTGITSINLPSTVTLIGSQAFKGCSSLETINIPFIGESATSTNNKFSYIFGTVPTSLKTVGFSQGNNITKIPDYAFENCSNITSINNNDTGNIVSIGTSAYSGTGITSIRLSSALTNVGQSAFSGCTGLTSVRFEKTNNYVNRKIGSSAFDNCVNLTGVEVPGGFSNTEQDHTPWFSLEAAKNWELNDFADVTSNPLYYAKNLKTQNVINNTSSTSEDYIKANYFKNFPSLSIKSFCYIGLTGIQLKINSVAQIGIGAFLGSSFDELHLSFIGIQDEAGALILKAQILSYAFQNVTITNSVDLDTNIFILFYEDAFRNFNISTTDQYFKQKFFKFIPGNEHWGSLCYFSNQDANPIGQNGVVLGEPSGDIGGTCGITEAWINTSEQAQAVSQGIDLKKWGYQYCNNLSVHSLRIIGSDTWEIPCGFCYGCSDLSSLPGTSFADLRISVVNDYGFYNCTGLNIQIKTPRPLSVGYKGFYNSGIHKISLMMAGGDMTFEDEAFAECKNLRLVEISDTYKLTIGSGIFENCNNLEYINIPSFGAHSYAPSREQWKGTIFNLFNTHPSSFGLIPELGAYFCVGRYNLFLPHSLKEFISTSARNYNTTFPVIGYNFYNNNDGSSPALLFQQGQGKTTVRNSASSYSEKAFENNKGTITVN